MILSKYLTPSLVALGLWSLVACSDSNFEAKSRITSAKLEYAKPVADGGNSGSDAENGASTPAPSNGSSTNTGSTDGSLPAAQPVTNITPEPAVGPSIIAGATLTCIRTNVATQVECRATVKSAPVDLVPKNLYHIKGSPGVWTPVKYARTDVGVYLATLEAAPATMFAMSVSYGANQYLIDMIGEDVGVPEYLSIAKDGSFDAIPADTNPYRFITPASLDTYGSAWEIAHVDPTVCGDYGANPPLLNLQGIEPSSGLGPRWVNLVSICASTNTRERTMLSQKIATHPLHVYQIYWKAKKVTAGAGGSTAEFPRMKILIDTAIIDYWDVPSVDFGKSLEYRHVAAGAQFNLLFEDLAQNAALSVGLDDIRVYDLGLPVFK